MTGNASILLVEDDAFTGRMMELQFRKHGYDVSLATNGEEALSLFAKNRFDLVLTDVMMPGMSGIEVLAKIREKQGKDRLPVILLTALGDAASILEGLERGASDFMGKTSEFGIVLAKVEHHLEVARLRTEAHSDTEDRIRLGDAPWNWQISRQEMLYSARFHGILGLAPKSLGQDPQAWLTRIHEADAARVKAHLDAHLGRRKAHFEADFRIRHALGHYLWVHAFGVAAFDRNGQAVRMVGGLFTLSDGGAIVAEALGQLAKLAQFCENLNLPEQQQAELAERLVACRKTLEAGSSD